MVVCRVADGDIAFLPGHVPFIGTLETYPVRIIHDDGTEDIIAVHQGFVEVAHDRVSILSDVAELKDAVDVRRAQAAMARAEEALRIDGDDEEAKAALNRARVRLDVSNA